MTVEMDEYRKFAPKGTVDFLHRLGDLVQGHSFLHVTSVRYGGGVAEILRRLVPMMKALGVESRWEVITGVQEYFDVTRSLCRALQGRDEHLTEEMYDVFLQNNERNARMLNLDADLVMVHDPQPAALVEHRKQGAWLWRCHLDIAQPQRRAWSFLRRFIVKFDGAIFSLPDFSQRLPIPQFVVYPSIDPLSAKNCELSRGEVNQVLDRMKVPRDKAILLQVSRFERFQDPVGTFAAYRLVKKQHDCRLVLAGSGASHDPEGESVLAELQERAGKDPDVHILQLPPEADLEINALQRSASIVVQKAVKSGFGLAVSEAMWKGKPVIGGTAGGIAAQVIDDVTGFIVHSVEGAAFRIRSLLNNPGMMGRMGGAGREHVRRHFLITRHLSDYLTLLKSVAAP